MELLSHCGLVEPFHTFEVFIVFYSSFQMAWEVIEKQGDYEVAFRWFPSKQKAEDFCLGRIGGKY